MSSVDEELEEIKRLIGSDTNESSLSSKEVDFSQKNVSGVPATWQKPGTPSPKEVSGVPAVRQRPSVPQPKQAPDVPAVRQRPGMPQPKQAPNVPAVRQGSGMPQPKQAHGAPAVRQRPEAPQLRQTPGIPSASQKIQPPLQKKASVTRGITEGSDSVRSYDIYDGGKGIKSSEPEPELDVGSEKFKINFDFDTAYKDVPEERPLRLRREKRTGCVGGILYGAFVISISILLAMLMWMAAVDVLGFGDLDEQVNVTIPTGFALDDITDMLYDAGLIKYKFLFNIYAGFSKAESKIKAGSYVLNRNFDYRALVQNMTEQARVREETTVTIPEGFTLAQIFTLLDDYGVCPANDLWEAATNHVFNYSFLDDDTIGDRLRLEGFLFPETYNFYLESTPAQAITTLLREFNKRFSEEYINRAEDMGYSVRDIIIVASMIEREAGNDEERPRIAAVIYNRLKSKDFPKIQIDATIHYAIAGTDRPFSTDIDTPYNTYLYDGLPPGPISNPGMASILAALYPETTNEYYYALNKEGTHDFFRTRAQHEAFVASDKYGGGG